MREGRGSRGEVRNEEEAKEKTKEIASLANPVSAISHCVVFNGLQTGSWRGLDRGVSGGGGSGWGYESRPGEEG